MSDAMTGDQYRMVISVHHYLSKTMRTQHLPLMQLPFMHLPLIHLPLVHLPLMHRVILPLYPHTTLPTYHPTRSGVSSLLALWMNLFAPPQPQNLPTCYLPRPPLLFLFFFGLLPWGWGESGVAFVN